MLTTEAFPWLQPVLCTVIVNIFISCSFDHMFWKIIILQFLQVTQLESEILTKIILTSNSLPQNPLLIFVGTNSYIYFKTYIRYYIFNVAYLNLTEAAFLKTFIYQFIIVLPYIYLNILFLIYVLSHITYIPISQFITFISVLAEHKMLNTFFNFTGVLEIFIFS